MCVHISWQVASISFVSSAQCCAVMLCRVWNVEAMAQSACKVLPHPSFVYAAKYHTDIRKLVVTGGFDRLLRVWNLESDGNTASVCVTAYTSLLHSFHFILTERGL